MEKEELRTLRDALKALNERHSNWREKKKPKRDTSSYPMAHSISKPSSATLLSSLSMGSLTSKYQPGSIFAQGISSLSTNKVSVGSSRLWTPKGDSTRWVEVEACSWVYEDLTKPTAQRKYIRFHRISGAAFHPLPRLQEASWAAFSQTSKHLFFQE